MAEKFLGIIQQFSKSDLSQFLQRNEHSDFEEILMKGEINNGEKFLKLTELQMIKWKLPLGTKRKILLFLSDVKENPNNFLGKELTEKFGALNRRQSLRTKNDIRERLEQVMAVPKQPTEPKPIKKPPLPARSPVEVEQPLPSPSPPQEYLPMDQGKLNNLETHYDDSGYLIPIEASKIVEEDTYEPPPTEKIITNFASSTNPQTQNSSPMLRLPSAFNTYPRTTPISRRAPLALPRDSTDERGYIRGPEDLATSIQKHAEAAPLLFPRVVQKNQRNIPFKPSASTPSPTLPLQMPKASAESDSEEELVDYEPIDEEHDDAPSTMSPGVPNTDNQIGAFSRLLNLTFLKKGKKADMPKSEPIDIRRNSLDRKNMPQKSSPSGRSLSLRSHSPNYTSRPLPPLPSSPGHFKPPDTKDTSDEPLEEYENVEKHRQRRVPKVEESEEPLEAYENIHKHNKATTPQLQEDEPLEPYENIQRRPSSESTGRTQGVLPKKSFKSDKPKPASSPAAEDEPSVTYGNIEENKTPKVPESYEVYHVKNSKFGKKPLPLPPISLPQIKLEQVLLPNEDEDHDDEPEEYGQYLFNLNDEPFYRNTDRKGSRLLLHDLGDGAFLFRPSKKFFLTISLKYHGRYFNLGIEKTSNNKVRLNTSGSNMSPEFATLTDFVDHFTRDKLSFEHQGNVIETYLNTTLPSNRF